MTGRQLHRMLTFAMSLAMVVLGAALVAQVAGGDGGVASARLLLGVLLLAAGLLRTVAELRRGRQT